MNPERTNVTQELRDLKRIETNTDNTRIDYVVQLHQKAQPTSTAEAFCKALINQQWRNPFYRACLPDIRELVLHIP